MKRTKKFIFLPVIFAGFLLLGACNFNSAPEEKPEDNTQQNNNPVTTFTVSFGANGGTGSMASVSGVSGEYTLPACTFTAPEGKQFAGWKVGGQGNLLAVGAKITVSADTQLVAQWETITYVVSFSANGGSGTMANVSDIVGQYTLPACTYTAPEGKQFAGWKVGGEGELLAAGGVITVSANTQLVAQWEDIPVVTFTVSFSANGGTGEMADVPEIAGAYALPANEFTAPAGKYFAGWKVNGAGETLQPGATITVSANVQLVAQWELIKYTVSFGANGGSGTMADVPNILGEYTLPACTLTAPDATKEFVGWKVGGAGETLLPGATITVSADTQLVAQWAVKQYTVQFKVDGELYGQAQTVAHGALVTPPEDPTKAGDAQNYKFRFAGWDRDLEQPIVENTVINAKFEGYAQEIVIDDFESYADSESLVDAEWVALGWDNSIKQWTDETNAAVSLGTRSVEGEKSLRFDAWQNKVTYKFAKEFADDQFPKEANALQMELMVPKGLTVNVLFTANADVIDATTHEVKNYDVEFQYKFVATTGGFVQYTIPLGDGNWRAWGDEGKTIKLLANAIGLHEDDILKTAKKIEFSLTGDDGGTGAPYVAFLDSLKFVTLDAPAKSEIETINPASKYTGLANNGKTVKIELGAAGAATASVIDLETPINVAGHIALEGQQITFTSDDETTLVYTGKLTEEGKVIEWVSSSGALNSAVTGMKFNAVQLVENYEQYTEEGTAYYQSSGIAEKSGARGAYYAEYYAGSGTASWGGTGWTLMGGSGDQMKLKNDYGGHNGSKQYMSYKNSASFGMRYMQFGLYDGSAEQQFYRGSKLSFWARTYNRLPEFKVSMYSKSNPKATNKDQNVKSIVVNPSTAIGSWTHYEVDLNPSLVYYGFMIFMEKNQVTDAYLYLDDIEVYTASPYATYAAPVPAPAALEEGSLYSASIGGLVRANLKVVDDTNVTLTAPGLSMDVNGTYAIANGELTATFTGGTVYKATIAQDLSKLTFKSVEGGAAQISGALNKLSFSKTLLLEDAESYTESGTMYYQSSGEDARSGARGAYYCDYYAGSGTSPVGGSNWMLMGGSGDQLSLEDSMGANGSSQSLKLKASSAGLRYLQWDLYKGTTTPYRGYKRLVVYIKGDATTNVTAKLYAFKNYKLSTSNLTNRAETEITIPAGSGWTPYTVILDQNTTYYGFGIYLKSSATAYVYVDDVHFDMAGADYNFGIKQGAILAGELNDGVAASFKFVDSKNIQLTCAALSLDKATCSYRMFMYGGNQIMEITIGSGDNKTVIQGVYAVDALGAITFTIGAASGAAAAQVKVGNVFSIPQQ